jgi:hypothetical protein
MMMMMRVPMPIYMPLGLPPRWVLQTSVCPPGPPGTDAAMIGFFLLLVLLMVLVAVCVPLLSGSGRRIYVDRRTYADPDVVEVVDDAPYDAADDGLRPMVRRRRVVRRTRRTY